MKHPDLSNGGDSIVIGGFQVVYGGDFSNLNRSERSQTYTVTRLLQASTR